MVKTNLYHPAIPPNQKEGFFPRINFAFIFISFLENVLKELFSLLLVQGGDGGVVNYIILYTYQIKSSKLFYSYAGCVLHD